MEIVEEIRALRGRGKLKGSEESLREYGQFRANINGYAEIEQFILLLISSPNCKPT